MSNRPAGDWEHVGDVDVRSSFGDPAKSLGVWRRRRDGAVNLDVRYAGVVLDAAARDKLRELLDRAAMPGLRADGEAPAAGAREHG